MYPFKLFCQHAGCGLEGWFYDPSEALWTFDTDACKWRQRHATGELPDPSEIWTHSESFVIVGGYAYLMYFPSWPKAVKVFRLDLWNWHWEKLPHRGCKPASVFGHAAAVVQVCLACAACQDADQELASAGSHGYAAATQNSLV